MNTVSMFYMTSSPFCNCLFLASLAIQTLFDFSGYRQTRWTSPCIFCLSWWKVATWGHLSESLVRSRYVSFYKKNKNQKGCVGIRKLKAYEKTSSFLVKQIPSNKMVSKLFDRWSIRSNFDPSFKKQFYIIFTHLDAVITKRYIFNK